MSDLPAETGLLHSADAARFARSGHFVYESGDHGDAWLELARLFSEPRRLRLAAASLAVRIRPYDVDVVCGPLAGGALIGQRVADEAGVSFVFAEPRGDPAPGAVRYLIPGELHPAVAGRLVGIVDDAINTGSAAGACAREIESLGGRVLVVACLILREGAGPGIASAVGAPVEALETIRWNTWPSSDCDLCRAGVALDDGRRGS